MTQEEKELLLKDLCARLPYKPIVQIDDCGIWNLRGVDHDDSAELRDRVIVWRGKNYPSSKNSFPIINCKPYLFPLSSMTDEQKEELKSKCIHTETEEDWEGVRCDVWGIEILKKYDTRRWDNPIWLSTINMDAIDWLNAHHFDYRGLIPMGFAIDATGLNIY